jgi:glycosyltransferase involved in cell wall biosynthesis
MRVLLTALSGAEQPTGICRAAVNLVRALNLADRSCEIVLAVGQWQQHYFDERLGSGVLNVELAPIHISNNAIARNWWYANALPNLVKRNGVDVVHTGFPVPIFRSRFNCPVLTTLHDLYPYDRRENFGYPRVMWNRAFLKQSLRACDRVICVSQFTQRRLTYHFPTVAAKSLYIPNEIAAPAAASSLPDPVSSPFLLTVAQHRANKRLDLLIETFSEAKARGVVSPTTRLVILGAPGPETSHLEITVQRLSLQDHVLFLSNLPDSELTALYEQCALYISLADIEGFGLPVAEALQCGARVLVSDIAAHREVGGDRCAYVEVSRTPDQSKVLNAIGEALGRPRSTRRRHAHTSATGERVLDVYRDVILRKSRLNDALQHEAAAS